MVDVDGNSIMNNGSSINGLLPGIQCTGIAENLSREEEDEKQPSEEKERDDRNNSKGNFAAMRMNKSLSRWERVG